MSVERAADFGQDAQVAVDEPGDAVAVLDRTPPAASPHVEAPLGQAEVLLDVDQQEAHARPVLPRWPQAVLDTPALGSLEQDLGIRAKVPAPRIGRIVRIWHRQLPARCTTSRRPMLRHFALG